MPSIRVVVLLIAASVPLFIGVETLLRVYLLEPLYGPLLSDLREFYWPEMTPERQAMRATWVAWASLAAAFVAGFIGIVALRRAVGRAKQSGEAITPAKLRDTLLLLTSIPQIPGLLAALSLAFGPELLPVLLCVATSTGFVIAQGFTSERLLEEMGQAAGA